MKDLNSKACKIADTYKHDINEDKSLEEVKSLKHFKP